MQKAYHRAEWLDIINYSSVYGFWKSIACVASVAVRAERNIGPRENGARAKSTLLEGVSLNQRRIREYRDFLFAVKKLQNRTIFFMKLHLEMALSR